MADCSDELDPFPGGDRGPESTTGAKKDRYIVVIGNREPLAIAPDGESQRALWLLIRQRTAINETAAKALLDDGNMIVGGEMTVVREDVAAHLRHNR